MDPDGSFRFTAYRHCNPEHAEIGPATLQGSIREGGRFNPPGEFGALYVTLEPQTVEAELRRRATRFGVPAEDLLPRAVLTLDVGLTRVLDLTDPATRAEWGLSLAELANDDFSACQEVGRAARRAGYEAVLFPSAANSAANNLAIFADRLYPGSWVDIVDTSPLHLSETDSPSST